MDVLNKKEKEQLLNEVNSEERIERESTLSWDGANLLARIPKEIAGYLGINKKNRFEKNILFVIEEKNGVVNKNFEIVDRKTPKRKIKKKFKENAKKSK